MGRVAQRRRVRALLAHGELRLRGGRGNGVRHAGADLRPHLHLARDRGRRRPHRRTGEPGRLRRGAARLAAARRRRAQRDAPARARVLRAALPPRQRVRLPHRGARDGGGVTRNVNSFAWAVGEFLVYPLLLLIATPLYIEALGLAGYGQWLLVAGVIGVAGIA